MSEELGGDMDIPQTRNPNPITSREFEVAPALFNFCDWCKSGYPSETIPFYPVQIRSSEGDEYHWVCEMCLYCTRGRSEDIYHKFMKTYHPGRKKSRKRKKRK
jgi:hypothetical protein